MITTALVYFAGLVINALLLIMFPFRGSNGFPAGVDSAISTASSYVGRAGTIIDLSTVHVVILFVITFELTVLTFYILRWLFGYIPIVGGR